MTLTQIYATYNIGSKGFCNAVDTHCGFCISMEEIKRIALLANTAEEFQMIWEG